MEQPTCPNCSGKTFQMEEMSISPDGVFTTTISCKDCKTNLVFEGKDGKDAPKHTEEWGSNQ